MDNYFNSNFNNGLCREYHKQDESQQKRDNFRSQIRSRAHEQYFDKVRLSIAQHYAQKYNDDRSNRSQHSIYNNNQVNQFKSDKNQFDLVKTSDYKKFRLPECLTYSNQLNILSHFLNEQQNESLSNLSKLADFYNHLRSSPLDFYKQSVQGHREQIETMLCRLLQRVLQQVETKLVAAQYLYHNELVSFKHPSQQYNEDCSIIFMLVMIYKELENLLNKYQNKNINKNAGNLVYFYKDRLMKMCNQSKVIDRHVLNMLGITNKAITN